MTDCYRDQIRNRNRFADRERKDCGSTVETSREATNEPEPAQVETSAVPNARLKFVLEHAPVLLYSPRRRRSLTRSIATWSMWRASAGWNIKGQITVNMAQVFTKTATKYELRADFIHARRCKLKFEKSLTLPLGFDGCVNKPVPGATGGGLQKP